MGYEYYLVIPTSYDRSDEDGLEKKMNAAADEDGFRFVTVIDNENVFAVLMEREVPDD